MDYAGLTPPVRRIRTRIPGLQLQSADVMFVHRIFSGEAGGNKPKWS
jgi:hypothetical protein